MSRIKPVGNTLLQNVHHLIDQVVSSNVLCNGSQLSRTAKGTTPEIEISWDEHSKGVYFGLDGLLKLGKAGWVGVVGGEPGNGGQFVTEDPTVPNHTLHVTLDGQVLDIIFVCGALEGLTVVGPAENEQPSCITDSPVGPNLLADIPGNGVCHVNAGWVRFRVGIKDGLLASLCKFGQSDGSGESGLGCNYGITLLVQSEGAIEDV